MTFRALFGSELRRLAARRAVRVALLVALALVVAIVAIAAIRSTGTGPFDHTMKLRSLWLVTGDHVDETMLLSVSVYVFIIAVGIGATAVGGDYRAGTVGTPLTWEPRRLRVAGARLLATAVVASTVYLVVVGVLIGGWYAGSAARGSTAGVGTGFWSHVLGLVLRATFTAAALAVITAAIVLVTRSTVGGILAWFAYAIGIEAILAGRITGLRPRLLFPNLAAFLQGISLEFREPVNDRLYHLGAAGGLVLLIAVTVVVGGLGLLAFDRRDVT